MLKSRLQTISQELTNKIEAASAEQQRSICTAVSMFAVRKTELHDATIERGLQCLRDGDYGSAPSSTDFRQVIDALDLEYFMAQENFEAGKGDKATYQRLFGKARAASAVMFALEEDAFHAAAEATYEAGAAIGLEPLELANQMLGYSTVDYNAGLTPPPSK